MFLSPVSFPEAQPRQLCRRQHWLYAKVLSLGGPSQEPPSPAPRRTTDVTGGPDLKTI